MIRVLLIFSILISYTLTLQGQVNKSRKMIQVWNTGVTKEASTWDKSKSVSSLLSSRWKIKQDSVPSIQVSGSQGIKRFISDKNCVMKVELPNSGKTFSLDRIQILESLMSQINISTKKKKEADRAVIVSTMESGFRKEIPSLYEDEQWNNYLSNKSFDSILPAFDRYVRYKLIQLKANPKDSLDQKNYAKDSLKIMITVKKIRSAADKSILSIDYENYEEIKKSNKIVSSKYNLPSIPYCFNISELVKGSSSWSPSDVRINLEAQGKAYIRITFDTLWVSIPTEMPIADSALCETDLIGEDIKNSIDVKKYTPCSGVAGFDCNGRYTPSFWERKSFSIAFSKNGTQEIAGSLEPAYNYLESNKLELRKVNINAYASIEGETERNLNLANERANVMVKILRSSQKDSVDADILCAENWKDFYKDLPKTPFATEWKDFDSLKIKSLVNDSANSKALEPWLKNHRYANLEIFGQKKMSEKEKMDVIKEQYNTYIKSLTAAPENRKGPWEQKVNAMRNWVVKEYLAGKMSKNEAEEFYQVMTPGLRIADFYLQSKILPANKEFLGAGKEEWFLNTMKSALIRRKQLSADLSTLLSSAQPNPKNQAEAELKLDMNMDFLRQCVQVMIYSVRKGRISASVYDSLSLPQNEDMIPLQVLINYSRTDGNVSVRDSSKAIQFYEKKQPSSMRYVKDYKLSRCLDNIYCVKDPNYKDLKAAILRPKKMSEASKELMKKVAEIFFEVQVSETNELEEKYYDDELDIFKIRELEEKLIIKGMCKIQRDKLILETSKKAAVFRFHQEEKNKSPELDALSAYYVRQKAFASPALVETIARMLLWFDKDGSTAKENIQKAQEFLRRMSVETDKRYRSLRPLMDKINVLALKSSLIEK
jgi:hypothetical protein